MIRTARLRRLPRRRPAAEALEGRQLLAASFGAPRTVAVGDIQQAAVGRLTGDGRDDLVIAEGGTNPGIYVKLSNGDGTFRAPVKVATTLGFNNAYPQGVFALGDFLGDGKLDVAFSPDGRSVEVLPGRGDGTFGAPIVTPGVNSGGTISVIATADFNGDGKADLLLKVEGPDPIAGGLVDEVALGRGDGTFAAKPVDVNNMGFTPVVADFNGDGPADLATVGPVPASNYDAGGPGGIQFGHTDGTFTGVIPPHAGADAIGFYPYLAADFNGDGKPDVVTRAVSGYMGEEPGGPIAVALNRGDGTFGPSRPLVDPALTAGFEAAVAADFNGDGKLDLVVACKGSLASPGESFFLLAGDGDGTFRPPAFLRSSDTAGVGTILAGDFNGDGKPDVVALSARVYGPNGLPEPRSLIALLNSPAVPPTVSGHLDPASDTGASHTDGITANATPTFAGRATPGATITLSAHRLGVPGAVTVARTTARADGSWRATASRLRAGVYTVTATATLDGRSATALLLGGSTPLQVVTAPPEITAVALDARSGRLTVTFAAPGPGGLDRSLPSHPAAIALSPGCGRNRPLAITAVTLANLPGHPGTQTLVATLAGGRPLGPGRYTLRIAAAGVRDVAGNPLDGAFRGSFPSGNGRAGGDFVARFLVAGGRAGRPIPLR